MEKYFITPYHMAHLIQNILFLLVFVIFSYCIIFHNGLKMDYHNVSFLFHLSVLSPNQRNAPFLLKFGSYWRPKFVGIFDGHSSRHIL
jgi:hypothetical protein